MSRPGRRHAPVLHRLLAAFFVLLLVAPTLALAQEVKALRGVALVIGQSQYEHLAPLPNPANDADAIEALLGDLGFDSVRRADRKAATLARDLDRFAEDAGEADVAVLYYSGHGIEAGGENFLIPVDADLSSLAAAGEKLVPLSALVEKLKATVPVVIVMLDACRDNPFPPGATLRLSPGAEPMLVGAGGLGLSRGAAGLKAMQAQGAADANVGTVIAFAAEPGKVALDGAAGGNSPYAAALLRHFNAMAGEEFGTVMRMVAEEVYLKTGGRQRPWINESLRRLLYFGGQPADAEGEEGEILRERRQLLVTIAALPSAKRLAVERIAAADSLPMDAVYGMLRALGQEAPADPQALEKLLAEQAGRVRKLMADRTVLASSDADIGRLTRLAERAVAEGALETAIRFHERAKSRVAELERTVEDAEAELRARRLEFASVFLDSGRSNEMAFRLREAAEDYENAFRQAERWDAQTAFVAKNLAAHVLGRLGSEQGSAGDLQQARQSGEHALDLLRRLPSLEQTPRDLAEAVTKLNLAMIRSTSGRREHGSAGVAEAIAAYREVGAAIERYRAPEDHGLPAKMAGDIETMRRHVRASLATLLVVTARRDGDIAPLREALAIQKALIHSIDAGETEPRAVAELGYGHAAVVLADRFDDDSELAAFLPRLRQAALLPFEGHDEGFRVEARRGLCDALVAQGRFVATIGEAIALFEECATLARETLARSTAPAARLQRADLRNSLGRALTEIARREDGIERLEQAAEAYRAALVDITRDTDPAAWVAITANATSVLRALGNMGFPERLQEAIALNEALLPEWKAQQRDGDWAETLVTISDMHRQLGSMTSDRDAYRKAVALVREAQSAWSRDREPVVWSIGHARLGDALKESSYLEDDMIGTLEQAIAAYETALSEPGYDITVRSWAWTQLGLGDAADQVAGFMESPEHARKAVTAYRNALEGFTRAGNETHRPRLESRLRELAAQAGDDRG